MPSKGTVRIFVDQADRQEYKRRAKACGLADRHYLHFLMRGLDAAEETCADLQSKLAASEEARRLALEQSERRKVAWGRCSGALSEVTSKYGEALRSATQWKEECERHRSMTARDHFCAAVRRVGPLGMAVYAVVAFLFGYGLASFASFVWGMI